MYLEYFFPDITYIIAKFVHVLCALLNLLYITESSTLLQEVYFITVMFMMCLVLHVIFLAREVDTFLFFFPIFFGGKGGRIF